MAKEIICKSDMDPKDFDFSDMAAKIKAELVFQNLMQLPPEIRIPLYYKIMNEDT